MNAAAQNALLKTLEEPADRTLIILLTDQPDALLATIRSRCQIIRFMALSAEMVQSQLEKRGMEKSLARRAAELSGGSLGLGLRWIQDGVIEAGEQLQGQINDLLAGKAPPDLAGWFRAAAEAYAQKQLERDELASKDQATREGLSLYLQIAGESFRRVLARSDDRDLLSRVCQAIDAVARAQTYLEANVSIPLIFQQLGIALEQELMGAVRCEG